MPIMGPVDWADAPGMQLTRLLQVYVQLRDDPFLSDKDHHALVSAILDEVMGRTVKVGFTPD